jgi:4-hydroxybutyrate CoA-transferase
VLSRIVPMLKQGAGVVTTRNHVRYIVTEYGVADLFARSVRERVHSLVSIAAPQFREELLHFAKQQHWI